MEEIDCMRLTAFGAGIKGLGHWNSVDRSDDDQAEEVLRRWRPQDGFV